MPVINTLRMVCQYLGFMFLVLRTLCLRKLPPRVYPVKYVLPGIHGCNPRNFYVGITYMRKDVGQG